MLDGEGGKCMEEMPHRLCKKTKVDDCLFICIYIYIHNIFISGDGPFPVSVFAIKKTPCIDAFSYLASMFSFFNPKLPPIPGLPYFCCIH